jgi:N-acetylated-alpha-linked acidic dipeptidase
MIRMKVSMDNKQLEQALLSEINGDEMFKHLEKICSYDRLSGSPAESDAIDYVVGVLKEIGLPVEVHAFEAYISNPIHGAVEVLGPNAFPVKAKTRAFSATTPEGGISGEVVYVPGSKDMFKDTETQKRIEALDLTGKIVITEGGGRSNMIAAQAKGAVGFIHLWPSDEDYVHEGTVSPVWGTPTPESVKILPKIPVVQITNGDGMKLLAMLEAGAVTVTLTTKTETRWQTLRLPVTEIKGESDEFVLVAGHIDSWHLGVTDNGTGNVACLEIARVFKKLQPHLKRSVRIAWWPGHSNGRYSGSSWYADHFWQDLYEKCVTYINIDSPGALGATDYSLISAVAENASLLCGIVSELTNQKVEWERPVRAGDQSFWGTGVTSAYMLLSSRPEGQRAAVGGCGLGWWWHTEEDTMDKAEKSVQVLDTKIHALTALRLAQADILPFDLKAIGAELESEIGQIGKAVAAHLDLSKVQAAAGAFLQEVGRFESGKLQLDADEANRRQLKALRFLTEINYTVGSKFDHDAAVPAKPVPGLQPAVSLSTLSPESDNYKFLRTKMDRERNRLQFAFRQATLTLSGQ